jgi:osmotically-inducible protein OsmY
MVNADQMKEHIARHLKWDNSLKGSNIQVDYIGKKAVLSGTVPNLVAHAAAQNDALNIPGVDTVENRLEVQYIHDHPNKTDETLKTDIEKVLGCTIETSGKRIQVEVMDGIAILSGTTDSYWKKTRIEDLASSMEGVLDIHNEIKVTPQEKTPDDTIQKEIILALNRMEVVGINNVQVTVKNGIVTLSGTVPTWPTAFDIEDTARFTSGVTGIKNKLIVD